MINTQSVYAGPGGRAVCSEGLLVVETVGSNLASCMVVCTLSVYVMLSQTEALLSAEHLSKDSCDVCVRNESVIEKAWALQ